MNRTMKLLCMIAVFLCFPWVPLTHKSRMGKFETLCRGKQGIAAKGKAKEPGGFYGKLHHGRMGGKRCRFL